MLVVVDTNVVGVDPPLGGNAMRRLLDASRDGSIRLVIPELVRAEATNSWADQVVEQLQYERRAQQALLRLGVKRAHARVPSRLNLQADKRAALDIELNEARVGTAPMPRVSHDALVKRALDRQRPFDADGKDGYRDSLLWETVLELAVDDQIVFVSRDVRAFFDGTSEKGLHRALATELRQRCPTDDAVKLFFNLDEAIDFAVKATAAEQVLIHADRDRAAKRELKDRLRDPEFHDMLVESMREAAGWEDMSWDDLRPLLPHRLTDEVQIEQIEDVADIRLHEVHRLSREVVATLTARLLISIQAHLPAAAAGSIDEDDALVFGLSEQGGYLRASAIRAVRGVFEASFDPDDWSVGRIRLRRFARVRR